MSARLVIPFLLLALPAWAEPAPDATRLGAVHLTDAPDSDLLRLPACDGSDNRPVTRLKVRVAEHPAEIERLDVTFHNGESQQVRVRETFAAGSESRWIDVEGPARCIATIRLVGDTETARRAPGKRARVAFWGDAVTRAEVAASEPFLGKVTLSDRPDRDVIDLAECPGPKNHAVREVKVGVLDHRAELGRIKVVYGNGEETVVEIGASFAPGEHSEWRSLPGEARCIDKIVVLGDAQSIGRRPGKQATVAFFGR